MLTNGVVATHDGIQRIEPGHNASVYSTAKVLGMTNCNCNAGFSSGIVLDPFFGAGTTGLVALKQGKHYLGIELNPEYVQMATECLAKLDSEKPKVKAEAPTWI